MTFTVLFVCTGNICRSPMAERLFRRALDAQLPIVVESAGTYGLDGWAMDAPSALVLRDLGGDPSGHSARRLHPDLVDGADLILTAEIEHRDLILADEPPTAPRTFTMREFGHFGIGLPALPRPHDAENLRRRVAQISEHRHAAPALAPRLADIGDPYGARLNLVRACGGQIAEAVEAAIGALGLRAVHTS